MVYWPNICSSGGRLAKRDGLAGRKPAEILVFRRRGLACAPRMAAARSGSPAFGRAEQQCSVAAKPPHCTTLIAHTTLPQAETKRYSRRRVTRGIYRSDPAGANNSIKVAINRRL